MLSTRYELKIVYAMQSLSHVLCKRSHNISLMLKAILDNAKAGERRWKFLFVPCWLAVSCSCYCYIILTDAIACHTSGRRKTWLSIVVTYNSITTSWETSFIQYHNILYTSVTHDSHLIISYFLTFITTQIKSSHTLTCKGWPSSTANTKYTDYHLPFL